MSKKPAMFAPGRRRGIDCGIGFSDANPTAVGSFCGCGLGGGVLLAAGAGVGCLRSLTEVRFDFFGVCSLGGADFTSGLGGDGAGSAGVSAGFDSGDDAPASSNSRK